MQKASGADRILCVANYESGVGYAWWLMESFWAALAKAHPGRVLLCYPHKSQIPQVIAESPIEVIQFDFNFANTRKLKAFVVAHDIAHIYLTDRKYVSPVYARLRRAGVRSITVHDHTPGDRTAPTGLKRRIKWLSARTSFAADRYIAVSSMVLERLKTVCQIPESKCHLATNGIRLDELITPVDIRKELDLPTNAIVVVSSSRVSEYKQVDKIIEAAASISNPYVYFVHCGDGEEMRACRQQIRTLGLEHRFFMLGRRNDVAGILASSNIAVHASKGEAALCLAIMEFMRAGLPVVLPNEPTVYQSVKHQVDGLLYSAGSAEALGDTIQRLIDDPALRQQMGNAARAHVQQYDIHNTVQAFLRVFEGV